MKRHIEARRVWAQGTDALTAAEAAIAKLQAALGKVQTQASEQQTAITALQTGSGAVTIACTAVTMSGNDPQLTEATLDAGAADGYTKIVEAVTSGKPLTLKYADPDGVAKYYWAAEVYAPRDGSLAAYAVFNTFRLSITKQSDGTYLHAWSANS